MFMALQLWCLMVHAALPWAAVFSLRLVGTVLCPDRFVITGLGVLDLLD
jgi:hypothetical protein